MRQAAGIIGVAPRRVCGCRTARVPPPAGCSAIPPTDLHALKTAKTASVGRSRMAQLCPASYGTALVLEDGSVQVGAHTRAHSLVCARMCLRAVGE